MKLHDRPRIELLYAQDNLIIPFEKGQSPALNDLIDSFGSLPVEKDYTVKIEEIKHKRSLDANGYFWALVGELAKKLNKGNLEIYRQLIYDNGSFKVVGMKEESVEEFTRVWTSNGDGWLVIDIGESKTVKGFRFIKAYAGSSTYNTKEMARLIDATVQECKEQGISTMTPQELEALKGAWKNDTLSN